MSLITSPIAVGGHPLRSRVTLPGRGRIGDVRILSLSFSSESRGIVFTSTADGNHGRVLKSKSTFEKLTYYNWSSTPSSVDPQQSVQEWLSVADAIHVD